MYVRIAGKLDALDGDGQAVGHWTTDHQVVGSPPSSNLSLGRLTSLIIYVLVTGWPHLARLICTKLD